jgi:predicted nucleic acid-binding Zn ribbon protein
MKRPPRRSVAGPVPASDAIAAALVFRGISDEVRANRVLTEWSELVGPKLAQRTRPDGITDRTLWVEVATSAWMHELNLLRPQLLKGLHDALGKTGEPALFDELKFRLAGRRRRPDAVALRSARPIAAVARPVQMPATGADRERIVREVDAVDDAELRALIARVRIAHDR